MTKVLELFCGMGGWSKAFHEQGFECTGLDLNDYGYPYRFIKADLFDWTPDQYYDIILASPPCEKFSKINAACNGNVDGRMGLGLVYRTFELIEKMKPKFWVIENVKGLGEYLPKPKEIVRYGRTKSHKEAWLWGNFPNLGMFESQIYHRHMDYSGGDPRRALIPYQLSQAMVKAMSNTKDRNCLT